MGKWTLAFALVIGATSGLDAAPSISVEPPYPLRQQHSTIRVEREGVPVEGMVVEALYRPNSQTSFSERLDPTDANGTTSWTPRDAGIVTLSAKDASGADTSAHVAVRYGTFPLPGVIVMIVAGLLLFGGASLGFVMLLREQRVPEEEPPST